MHRILVLCLALALSACEAKQLVSPVGPTPNGEPQATAKLQFRITPGNAANRVNIVITASNNDLSSAIMLDPNNQFVTGDSWSGSNMWIRDHNGVNFGVVVTSIPFTPPSNDRFTFSNYQVNPSAQYPIDVSFALQPGGGSTRRINVILNSSLTETPGQTGYVIVGPPTTNEWRVRGPMPK